MVPRRPTQRIDRPLPPMHKIRPMDRRLRAGIGRAPCLRRDRARRVGLVKPGLAHGGQGIAIGPIGRVNVRDHLGARPRNPRPAAVDRLQECQIPLRMHPQDRRKPRIRRLHHRPAQRPHRAQQRIHPRGLFRAGLRGPRGQKELRVMRPLRLFKDCDHPCIRARRPSPSKIN